MPNLNFAEAFGNQHIKLPRVGTQISHTHATKQSPPPFRPATAGRRFVEISTGWRFAVRNVRSDFNDVSLQRN